MAWSQEQLDKGKPEDSTAIDGYRGQWVGMSATYLRLACGLLAELGQLVHVNRSIIQSAIFQTALERVREGNHRGAWDEMVDAYERAPDASGNESFKEPVAKYLNKVRNKAAFHYGHRDDCEELMKGYAARFGGPVTSDGNDHTYVSLGVNAEGTRFYFADAAVIAWMEVARGSLTAQDIRSFFRRVNKALRFIVEGLLDQFEELASKAPGG